MIEVTSITEKHDADGDDVDYDKADANDDYTNDSASALNTTILLLVMMILMTQFLH